MTDKVKVYVERWLFIWIIGFIVACLGSIQYKKADNARVDKIEKRAEDNSEFNHRLETVLVRVETLLNERTKREVSK